MSLQDMTADEVIASIHNALEQELQKQYPTSPSYHSGHVALSYRMGARDERERIIKLLDNPLHHNIQSPGIHKDCYTCVLVDLIKGEQK